MISTTDCMYEVVMPTSPATHRCAVCGHTRQSSYPSHMLHRRCPMRQVERKADVVRPAETASLSDVLPCVHRGNEVRTVTCKLCGGGEKEVSVFACALFEECTLRRTKSGQDFKTCLGCSDRQETKTTTKKNRHRHRRRRGGLFPITPGENLWVSNERLVRDTLSLIPRLPPDLSAIAGVARSGLYPATILALHLHLPLLSLTREGLVDVGHGWRLIGHRQQQGKTLVIDDTTFKGGSLIHSRQIVAEHHPEIEALFAVVYKNPNSAATPDLHACDLPDPHLLEWNFPNSVYTTMAAYDFDGVLCRNPAPHEDDDGPNYLQFLETAEPLLLPRKGQLRLIVTARLEKYREPTQAWLARWNVQPQRLIMGPWSDQAERSRSNVAAWKAKKVASGGVRLYVESEPPLAKAIAELSGVPTLCPRSGHVY